MRPKILRLDSTGQPVVWITWQQAVCLYVRDQVAWTAGGHVFPVRGGMSRRTGQRSVVEVNSIVAVRGGHHRFSREAGTPPVSNRDLFLRDGHLCMYCGGRYAHHQLTRDHVLPLSRGGQDTWSNIVSACKPCNASKGGQTPEEAGMPLLAVPFTPNRAEYLVLSNRRILADQMEFLKTRFSRGSRLLAG
jgi:5-methylcytosine-specific restriction endonuclease McrA